MQRSTRSAIAKIFGNRASVGSTDRRYRLPPRSRLTPMKSVRNINPGPCATRSIAHRRRLSSNDVTATAAAAAAAASTVHVTAAVAVM